MRKTAETHTFAFRKSKQNLYHEKNIIHYYYSDSAFICCTIFTASKQNVTFRAPNGTKIYDVETNVKIAEVEKDNMVTTKIMTF